MIDIDFVSVVDKYQQSQIEIKTKTSMFCTRKTLLNILYKNLSRVYRHRALSDLEEKEIKYIGDIHFDHRKF